MLLLEGKREAAVRLARRRPGLVAAVCAELLTTPLTDKAALEEVATIQGRKELHRLTRRLPLLYLITGVAPLLGLLGTVLGLVQAFQKVAQRKGSSIQTSWPQGSGKRC